MKATTWNINVAHPALDCSCVACKAEKLIRLLKRDIAFGEVMVKAWDGGYVGPLWQYGHTYISGILGQNFIAFRPTVLGCLVVAGYPNGDRNCIWMRNDRAYERWEAYLAH